MMSAGGSAESATPIRSFDQPDGRRGAEFRDAPFRLIPVARPEWANRKGATATIARKLALPGSDGVDTVCVTDRAGVHAAV